MSIDIEPGYYWYNEGDGNHCMVEVDTDYSVSLMTQCFNSVEEFQQFYEGEAIILHQIPENPDLDKLLKLQDWPTCPECHFPLVRHIEGEPCHENIFWTCPDHGEFLIKQRYRVVER